MPHDTHLPQQRELALANARLVLDGETVTGGLRVARRADRGGGDRTAAVPAGAEDCAGDFLAPGLVELHTDNLERHLEPRPGVRWPETAAILAHDAELAGTGITTVFDALRVGSLVSGGKAGYGPYARSLASALMRLRRAGSLRIGHRLHLRAETCSETLAEELAEFGPQDGVGIVSLMDHTPGQRQFADVSKLKDYAIGRLEMNDAEFAAHVGSMQALGRRNVARHSAAAVAAAKAWGATLASHDDATAAQVAGSAAHGVGIAEFPTTREAAEACRAAGIAVMMGAPNLIRGGSHSGNVAAAALAEAGLLDILSSDYAPASLLIGAVRLGEILGSMAAGIAAVTAAPARAAGLADRGTDRAGAAGGSAALPDGGRAAGAERGLGRRRAGGLRRALLPARLSCRGAGGSAQAYRSGGAPGAADGEIAWNQFFGDPCRARAL